jgi:hypothetical protein
MTVASNAGFSVYGSVQTRIAGDNPAATGVPSSAWIQHYYPGTPSNNYATLAASVATNGMTVWQSYLAGMDPTNQNSRFFVTITNMAGQIVVVVPSVQTTTNYPNGVLRYYDVEQCTNLLGGLWQPCAGYTGIVANGGAINCTNAPQPAVIFYRAKARLQ